MPLQQQLCDQISGSVRVDLPPRAPHPAAPGTAAADPHRQQPPTAT
ncbi:hypothetical protein AB0F95_17805 [Micromonospora tulbaghiae]